MASPLSGRRAQAALDDARILESARAVFVDDPRAPVTAVAKRAGVGISALIQRATRARRICCASFATTVCSGSSWRPRRRWRTIATTWTAFADYMRRMVDADTSSMTLALAGTFTPTAEMFALAQRANELLRAVFERARDVLRPDLEVHDLSLIFELVAGLKLSDRAAHRAAAPALPGDDPGRAASPARARACPGRRRPGASSNGRWWREHTR